MNITTEIVVNLNLYYVSFKNTFKIKYRILKIKMNAGLYNKANSNIFIIFSALNDLFF